MLEWLSQGIVSLNPFVRHSNFYLTLNHSHGMDMMLEWHTNGISEKNSNCSIRKCCKNCYINFSVLKADNEIKIRRRTFTLKTLVYMKHIMWVRFILLWFLVFETRITHVMRCEIWYQTLKNGAQMVGQNVVLTIE